MKEEREERERECCVSCMWVPVEGKRVIIAWACKPPNVSAENQTQVPWKDSKFS